MTRQVMLLLVERELFDEIEGKVLREIESGQTMLSTRVVQRILRERRGRAGSAGAKDFTAIVSGFAPGVGHRKLQLTDEIVGAEFRLQ
jgi:hypothetical protein